MMVKCLQDEELSVVDAIEAVVKTNKSVAQCGTSNLEMIFPSVKKVNVSCAKCSR